jgi:hypothetical protein
VVLYIAADDRITSRTIGTTNLGATGDYAYLPWMSAITSDDDLVVLAVPQEGGRHQLDRPTMIWFVPGTLEERARVVLPEPPGLTEAWRMRLLALPDGVVLVYCTLALPNNVMRELMVCTAELRLCGREPDGTAGTAGTGRTTAIATASAWSHVAVPMRVPRDFGYHHFGLVPQADGRLLASFFSWYNYRDGADARRCVRALAVL